MIRLWRSTPTTEPTIPADADARLLLLEMQRNEAHADAQVLRAEVEALRARLAAKTGAAELARAHKTLLHYEDLLAGCREQHGSNSRSGPDAAREQAINGGHHALAFCEWCSQPVAGPLADCPRTACVYKNMQVKLVFQRSADR